MATKIIKAWIDGAIQEIEVEDIVSLEMEPSLDERVESLEGKHEVVITDGNLLVGNGTTELEEMTPEEVLSHINGASVATMTTEEYETLTDTETNANTLYLLTDSDDAEYTDVTEDYNAVAEEFGYETDKYFLTITQEGEYFINDGYHDYCKVVNNNGALHHTITSYGDENYKYITEYQDGIKVLGTFVSTSGNSLDFMEGDIISSSFIVRPKDDEGVSIHMDSYREDAFGNQRPALEFYGTLGDEQTILSNIASGVKDYDAVNVKQLKMNKQYVDDVVLPVIDDVRTLSQDVDTLSDNVNTLKDATEYQDITQDYDLSSAGSPLDYFVSRRMDEGKYYINGYHTQKDAQDIAYCEIRRTGSNGGIPVQTITVYLDDGGKQIWEYVNSVPSFGIEYRKDGIATLLAGEILVNNTPTKNQHIVNKQYVDNLTLITVEDIDTICGATISYADLSEVTF